MNERKKEGKKPCLTCFFSSFSSMIDGSSCFSGSATGTSAVSDFSLLRLFLFSFFLSFSCFSFLSDLSLRCLRLDSLDSVFQRKIKITYGSSKTLLQWNPVNTAPTRRAILSVLNRSILEKIYELFFRLVKRNSLLYTSVLSAGFHSTSTISLFMKHDKHDSQFSLNGHLCQKETKCWSLPFLSHLMVTILSIRRTSLKVGHRTFLKPMNGRLSSALCREKYLQTVKQVLYMTVKLLLINERLITQRENYSTFQSITSLFPFLVFCTSKTDLYSFRVGLSALSMVSVLERNDCPSLSYSFAN